MIEPLLSDDDLRSMCFGHSTAPIYMSTVRDFYEERLRPIPVSEKLPEEGVEVLAYLNRLEWRILSHDSESWSDADGYIYSNESVTHWKEMPPEP